MKILAIGGIQKPTDKLRLADIKASAADVWSYYVRLALAAMGIDTEPWMPANATATAAFTADYCERKPPPADCDHALSFKQRVYFDRVPLFYARMRAAVLDGLLTTICDHNRTPGAEDRLFHALDEPQRPEDIKVGWAADGNLLHPEKSERPTFLVDHPYYGADNRDVTQKVLAQLAHHNQAHIRVFADRAVIDVTEREVLQGVAYNQKGVSYVEAAAEYRRADAFFVTHPESLGYSVIEAAMAGALIVVPKGYINAEYLAPLRHIEWEGIIPQDRVFEMLDADACRKAAEPYNRWGRIAELIAGQFNPS